MHHYSSEEQEKQVTTYNMSKKTTLIEFIEKAKEIHLEKYDYSLVDYRSNKTKVSIICSKHGIFEQRPNNHLSGQGCKYCSSSIFSEKNTLSTEEFIEKAQQIHANIYDYSKAEYKTAKIKLKIVCKKHGEFLQIPNDHLNGHGCKYCGLEITSTKVTKSSKDFIKKVNEIHNNLYDYSKVLYIKRLNHIEVVCRIHGSFFQLPKNHIKGQGCPKCATENMGYGRNDFIKQAKNIICTFYILRCFNDNEEFYKIGITKHSVTKRYPSTKSMPYKYEIIKEIKGEAGEIWDLELTEKRKLQKNNYQPLIKFLGSKTECFNKII